MLIICNLQIKSSGVPYLLYPIADCHRATGLLPLPCKEDISVLFPACPHKLQIQMEISTGLLVLELISAATLPCIFSLMSKTSFLLSPPVQQQLQTHLIDSLLLLVIHLVHCLEKQSVSSCSLKMVMSSRKGTDYSHLVQTPSEIVNLIF